MERYSGSREMEADPAAGVEEPMPMWQLGIGESSYPERPQDPDCIYYLRTGFCGYGDRCRFNHPRDRHSTLVSFNYPDRIGQPLCQYYMRTGTCKFGGSCKYHHPKYGTGSSAPITLNFYGYPLKPGEKECSHYIKTGECKFGVTCRFHHPQPGGIQVYPTVQSPLQSSQQYGPLPIDGPAIHHGNYGPLIFPPLVVPLPSWTPYPNAYTGSYAPITSSAAGPSSRGHAFPERPGHPECQFYLRTGGCKFGPTCKYHHPREWTSPDTISSLSPMGLPLRPGAPLCSHYAQSGACRYGISCKFDHPIDTLSYSMSASSLTDMPLAPYLAPSDMRPDLLSGLVKDTFSSQTMSSSMTSSSTSVSVIYSKIGSLPAPHSSIQHSRSSSASSS